MPIINAKRAKKAEAMDTHKLGSLKTAPQKERSIEAMVNYFFFLVGSGRGKGTSLGSTL